MKHPPKGGCFFGYTHLMNGSELRRNAFFIIYGIFATWKTQKYSACAPS